MTQRGFAGGLSHCSLYINCHPCAGEDLRQNEAQSADIAPLNKRHPIPTARPTYRDPAPHPQDDALWERRKARERLPLCSLYINCHPCEGEDLRQNGTSGRYSAPSTNAARYQPRALPSRDPAPEAQDDGVIERVAALTDLLHIYINCHPCEGEDLRQDGAIGRYSAPQTPGRQSSTLAPHKTIMPNHSLYAARSRSATSCRVMFTLNCRGS